MHAYRIIAAAGSNSHGPRTPPLEGRTCIYDENENLGACNTWNSFMNPPGIIFRSDPRRTSAYKNLIHQSCREKIISLVPLPRINQRSNPIPAYICYIYIYICTSPEVEPYRLHPFYYTYTIALVYIYRGTYTFL